MNFVEKLQKQPRYIRVQILWISVILVMIVVILIWLMLLKNSFGFAGVKEEVSPKSSESDSVPSLFGTLKEDFLLFKQTLQATVKGILNPDSESKKEFEFEAGIK